MFAQAKKVGDIPFPFPYTQIVTYLQVCFLCSCPFVVMALISETIPAFFFTFFAAFCYSSLNEVAAELEDPFGTDPNDLPLFKLHLRYVHQLVQLGQSEVTREDLLTLVKGPEKIEERDRKHNRVKSIFLQLHKKALACGWRAWREKQEILNRQRALLARAAKGMLAHAYGKWFLRWHSGISAEELLLKKLRVAIEKLQDENAGIYHAGEVTLSETLQMIFSELDIDRSNSLQHHEVVNLCQRLGVDCTDEKFDILINNIDPTNSNAVTFDMFLRWYIIESGRHDVREAEKQAGRDRVIAAATADNMKRSLSQLSDNGSTVGATNPLIG